MANTTKSGASPLAGGALALALLYAVLVLPAQPSALANTWWWPLPMEWAAIVLLNLYLPRRLAGVFRAIVVATAGLLVTLKLADLATYSALNRAFNPLLDAKLPLFGWNVLSNSLGVPVAALSVSAALLGLLATLIVIGWGLAGLRRWPRPARAGLIGSCGVIVAAALAGAVALPASPPVLADAAASRHLMQRATRIAASARDLARFRRTLDTRTAPSIADDRLLKLLAGKHVLFAFVESYGRSALARPLYADVIQPRLAAFEHEIAASGFNARSGWLTSPTVGGQSWLAHATLLSGLWIDNQARFEALMASTQPSLNRLFKRSGWTTVAAMPAITRDWPEGAWFGYDRLYDSRNLGYQGQPFNWVTMPDQYTLAAIERQVLTTAAPRPAMIEAALISSHAPWTPIPPLLDWSRIGDGRVYDAYATQGDPPSVVWRDQDRVRAQYRKALDYSLATLTSFVARYGTLAAAERDLVIVILGDHQPAPLVTGTGATRDVPIHIISNDDAVLAAIDGWHWQPGMTPNDATPVWRMDAFYERFIRAFSVRPETSRQ